MTRTAVAELPVALPAAADAADVADDELLREDEAATTDKDEPKPDEDAPVAMGPDATPASDVVEVVVVSSAVVVPDDSGSSGALLGELPGALVRVAAGSDVDVAAAAGEEVVGVALGPKPGR